MEPETALMLFLVVVGVFVSAMISSVIAYHKGWDSGNRSMQPDVEWYRKRADHWEAKFDNTLKQLVQAESERDDANRQVDALMEAMCQITQFEPCKEGDDDE